MIFLIWKIPSISATWIVLQIGAFPMPFPPHYHPCDLSSLSPAFLRADHTLFPQTSSSHGFPDGTTFSFSHISVLDFWLLLYFKATGSVLPLPGSLPATTSRASLLPILGPEIHMTFKVYFRRHPYSTVCSTFWTLEMVGQGHWTWFMKKWSVFLCWWDREWGFQKIGLKITPLTLWIE